MTGSFKERGACDRIVRMNAAERARGIARASAGNHAQGVALAGRSAAAADRRPPGGVLVSSGNVDVNLLSPGALARLLDQVALQQADVLEVEHDHLGRGLDLAQTAAAVLLETVGSLTCTRFKPRLTAASRAR